MNSIASIYRAALLLILGGGLAFAQSPAQISTLPATRPTATSPTAPIPAIVPASAPKADQPAKHRAEVVYSQGQLSIAADNSSLNQILRDISSQTGMKITGGVTDQRVFGKYGPGAPAQILTDLLDGTDSNMLLRETASHAPAELVLTPRDGGPTPPSPSAASSDDDAPSSQQQPAGQATSSNPQILTSPQPPGPQPVGTMPQPSLASGFAGAPVVAPSTAASSAVGTTPQSPGASVPQSPNGIKTPQQIYQQLQQLHQ